MIIDPSRFEVDLKWYVFFVLVISSMADLMMRTKTVNNDLARLSDPITDPYGIKAAVRKTDDARYEEKKRLMTPTPPQQICKAIHFFVCLHIRTKFGRIIN